MRWSQRRAVPILVWLHLVLTWKCTRRLSAAFAQSTSRAALQLTVSVAAPQQLGGAREAQALQQQEVSYR